MAEWLSGEGRVGGLAERLSGWLGVRVAEWLVVSWLSV